MNLKNYNRLIGIGFLLLVVLLVSLNQYTTNYLNSHEQIVINDVFGVLHVDTSGNLAERFIFIDCQKIDEGSGKLSIKCRKLIN